MLAPQRRSSRTNIFFELFRGVASCVGVSPSEPVSSRTALPETGIPVRILQCCHTLSGDPSGGLHVVADVVTPRGTTLVYGAPKLPAGVECRSRRRCQLLVRSLQRSRGRQPRNLGETRGLFLEFLPFAKVLRDLRQNFGHRLPDIQPDAIFEMRDGVSAC